MPQLYKPPPPTGYEQQYAQPPVPPRPAGPPTGYEGQYTPPETVQNIPPPFRTPQPGEQRPLGINVPDQPERPGARGPQGELPLQPPRVEPVQGELDLGQANRGVTQLGLPGMDADVVHQAGDQTTISPDQDSPKAEYETQYDQQGRLRSLLKKKPPEGGGEPPDEGGTPAAEAPTQPKPSGAAKARAAKAPVTKDSEEQPTAAKAVRSTPEGKPLVTKADLKNADWRAGSDAGSKGYMRDTGGNEDYQRGYAFASEKDYVAPKVKGAAKAESMKPAAKAATKAAKPETKVDEGELSPGMKAWLASGEEGEKPAATKVSDEQTTVARAKSGKPIGTFDTSKIGEKTEPAKTGPEIVASKKPAGKQATGTFKEVPTGEIAGAPKMPTPSRKQEIAVTHKSSNIDSVEKGWEKRDLGISFARDAVPGEKPYSSPTVGDAEGRKGTIKATVKGKGLDYDIPAHKAYIEKLHELAEKLPGHRDVRVMNHLRANGIDWVSGWNGIGHSLENSTY